MAKEVNCEACEDLRQTDPNMIANGWSDAECASFKNDTGLVPSKGHNDCQDLEDMTDCLIGNMDAEVDKYEVCDWQKFMHDFLPNLWTVLTAIRCALCGIWTNIHALWGKVNDILDELERIWQNINNLWTLANRVDCIVDYLTSGATFYIGEAASEGSYVVAGKGVSFYEAGQSQWSGDVSITYVAGGFCRVNGSCIFHQNNFTDAEAVVNFDNGSVERTSQSRLGNTLWGQAGKPVSGGELAYEIRIKKSAFPQISRFFDGIGIEGAGAAYHAKVIFFNEGTYAYGQHGWCGYQTGDPAATGMDRGHLVPSGWMYIQVRMSYLDMALADGEQYTPSCICGVRLNQNAIEC